MVVDHLEPAILTNPGGAIFEREGKVVLRRQNNAAGLIEEAVFSTGDEPGKPFSSTTAAIPPSVKASAARNFASMAISPLQSR